MVKYPFETFKDDNKDKGFYMLLHNLRAEIDYAINYFSDYKEFFEKVNELLSLIREDILENNPDYNAVSFDSITFESTEIKLPNIQNILNYIIRLKNSLILSQNDRNDRKRMVFIPADLHHLTNSAIQSINIISELNTLVIKYDHGFINQEQLRRKLDWYIHDFLFEKYHLFNSLNSEFLK